MPVRDDPAKQLTRAEGAGWVLRRRQFRVVVRAPDASPGNFPRIVRDRRARVSTLAGLGAREAMPTLFDIVEGNEPTRPGLQFPHTVEWDAEQHLSLVPWEDDEDEDTSCFDV
jgi:hypothetical protein